MSLSAQAATFEKKRKDLHPDGKWQCPECKTWHEYPHWEDHHQKDKVDKAFCDGFCKESDSQHEVDETGTPKPLFCPKCGWREDRLIIIKAEKGEIVYA
jgi:hypothetical protein